MGFTFLMAKINPLADWTQNMVWVHIRMHHPIGNRKRSQERFLDEDQFGADPRTDYAFKSSFPVAWREM
jgi:hypothetical protein